LATPFSGLKISIISSSADVGILAFNKNFILLRGKYGRKRNLGLIEGNVCTTIVTYYLQ
jgi:hypothetical protein